MSKNNIISIFLTIVFSVFGSLYAQNTIFNNLIKYKIDTFRYSSVDEILKEDIKLGSKFFISNENLDLASTSEDYLTQYLLGEKKPLCKELDLDFDLDAGKLKVGQKRTGKVKVNRKKKAYLPARSYGIMDQYDLLTVFALKTNLLYDATLSPNLGFEIGVGGHSTLMIEASYNFLDMPNNLKWKHFMGSLEYRYWLESVFSGHFIGIHAGYSNYNIGGLKMPYYSYSDYYRYEGWAAGAGITYGYQWELTCSWHLAATIGLGLVYTEYDKYLQPVCGPYWGSFSNVMFMPTKAAIELSYVIGKCKGGKSSYNRGKYKNYPARKSRTTYGRR